MSCFWNFPNLKTYNGGGDFLTGFGARGDGDRARGPGVCPWVRALGLAFAPFAFAAPAAAPDAGFRRAGVGVAALMRGVLGEGLGIYRGGVEAPDLEELGDPGEGGVSCGIGIVSWVTTGVDWPDEDVEGGVPTGLDLSDCGVFFVEVKRSEERHGSGPGEHRGFRTVEGGVEAPETESSSSNACRLACCFVLGARFGDGLEIPRAGALGFGFAFALPGSPAEGGTVGVRTFAGADAPFPEGFRELVDGCCDGAWAFLGGCFLFAAPIFGFFPFATGCLGAAAARWALGEEGALRGFCRCLTGPKTCFPIFVIATTRYPGTEQV